MADGMMEAARRTRLIGLLCLGITAAGWAVNWPLMKILLRDWPPLFARGLAGVIAALILALLAVVRGQSLKVPAGVVPRLLFGAFTNVFAWMGFSTIAMKFVSVGEGALIIYTMPIWATLLAWPILRKRPTVWDVAALVLGMGGVALLLGGPGIVFDSGQLAGIVLSLSAAILFALGNVVNPRPLPIPPLAAVSWQVGIGCLAMFVLGVVFEHPQYGEITWAGFACFAYMALMSMGVCYLTWFETLRRVPPVAASMGMLLVPAIAIAAAAFILGEPLGAREIVAIALTLGGVSLALRTQLR